jgi:hypothetical protein
MASTFDRQKWLKEHGYLKEETPDDVPPPKAPSLFDRAKDFASKIYNSAPVQAIGSDIAETVTSDIPKGAVSAAKGMYDLGAGIARAGDTKIPGTNLPVGQALSPAFAATPAIESVVPGAMKKAQEFLQSQSAGQAARLQQLEEKKPTSNFVHELQQKGVEMAASLPLYALETAAGGAIPGFAAAGALGSAGRGEGIADIAKSGAQGAATGAIFKGGEGLKRPLRMATLGAGMGGMAAAEGGTPEQVAKEALSGGLLGILGGKGERSLRDVISPREAVPNPALAEAAAMDSRARDADFVSSIMEAAKQRVKNAAANRVVQRKAALDEFDQQLPKDNRGRFNLDEQVQENADLAARANDKPIANVRSVLPAVQSMLEQLNQKKIVTPTAPKPIIENPQIDVIPGRRVRTELPDPNIALPAVRSMLEQLNQRGGTATEPVAEKPLALPKPSFIPLGPETKAVPLPGRVEAPVEPQLKGLKATPTKEFNAKKPADAPAIDPKATPYTVVDAAGRPVTATRTADEAAEVVRNVSSKGMETEQPAVKESFTTEPSGKTGQQEGEIVTDPQRVQEIRNSIAEGEGILRSGSFNGKKRSPQYLASVKRSVESAKAKIGEAGKIEATIDPDRDGDPLKLKTLRRPDGQAQVVDTTTKASTNIVGATPAEAMGKAAEVFKDAGFQTKKGLRGSVLEIPQDRIAELKALRRDIEQATAGRRYGPAHQRDMIEASLLNYAQKQLIESGKVGASGGYEKSTFPIETGIGKDAQLKIIDKMLAGEPMTDKQQATAQQFLDHVEHQRNVARSFDPMIDDKVAGDSAGKKYTEVPAGTFGVGEKVKTPADTYTVKEQGDGYTVLEDGKIVTLKDDQTVPVEKFLGKEKPSAKEPWEMTRKEFFSQPHNRGDARFIGDQHHHDLVREKIGQGVKIPEEVLADYPDLAPKAEAAPQYQTDLGSNQTTLLQGEHLRRTMPAKGLRKGKPVEAGDLELWKAKAEADAANAQETIPGTGKGLKKSVTLGGGIPGAQAAYEAGERFVKDDVLPAAKELASTVVASAADVRDVLAPVTASESAKRGGGILRARAGEMAHAAVKVNEDLKAAKKYFGKQDDQANLDFIDRVERGEKQPTPELEGTAAIMREILDSRRKAIQALGTGKLQTFHENYFPRFYEEFFKGGGIKQAVGRIFGRKPLEGSKGFLKKRTFATFKEAIDSGLTPLSTNPVDYVILKAREMDKYLMAHQTLGDWKSNGIAKFVRSFDEVPEGWAPINDNIGTVYGPPTVQAKEYLDKSVYNGLLMVARDLGIRHERKTNAGRGALGISYQGANKIVTQFATETSVLAHEIGHQLDYKYDLWNKLFAKENGKGFNPGRSEFRAISDLTERGQSARSRVEKMAQLLEAYIHAPEKMQEVAPRVFKEYDAFLRSHEELKPLTEIRPGLALENRTTEIPHGGMLIVGRYYAPVEAAKLINNYLSPGLRERSGLFRAWMGANNTLNQFQLGLSAFHLGFTSVDAATSKVALALYQASKGDMKKAAVTMAKAPGAPVTNIRTGAKLIDAYKNGTTDPLMSKMVDAMKKGGGRIEMDRIYGTQIGERMVKALKDGNVIGAALRLPFAAVELASKPIMEYVVPRQKLGVFYDLARYEMERNPNMNEAQTQETMQRIWDSVDNRMGQLVYDNLFWHKAFKELAMASTRSVGWNLGTIREIGGGAVDIAKQPLKMLRGEKPELTYRASYIPALLITTGAIGALVNYLYTGTAPQEMKDYFFPRTGELDENGNPERVTLPSYLKDIYAYGKHPLRTVSHKTAPLISLISEIVNNKDYYGTEVRDQEAPFMTQAGQVAGHVAKSATPFSIRGVQKEKELGSPISKQYQSFIGLTPAPKELNMTTAEEAARAYLDRRPKFSRSAEQTERSQLRSKAWRSLRKGQSVPEDVVEAYREGKLSADDVKRFRRDSKFNGLQLQVKRLSMDEALNVYREANPDERRELKKIINTKWESFKKKHSKVEIGEMRQLIQQVKGEQNED